MLGMSQQFLTGFQFMLNINNVLAKCQKNTSQTFEPALG